MRILAFILGCLGWTCIFQIAPMSWSVAGWTFLACNLFLLEDVCKIIAAERIK